MRKEPETKVDLALSLKGNRRRFVKPSIMTVGGEAVIGARKPAGAREKDTRNGADRDKLKNAAAGEQITGPGRKGSAAKEQILGTTVENDRTIEEKLDEWVIAVKLTHATAGYNTGTKGAKDKTNIGHTVSKNKDVRETTIGRTDHT